MGVTTEDRSVSYSKGIAITTSFHPDEHTHVEVVRYSEGSDALAPLATLLTDGGPGLPRPLKYLKNVLTQPLTFLRSLWPFGKAKRGIFLLVMQTLDNSISLTMKRKWTRLFRRAFDTDRGTGAPNPTYIPLGNEVARVFAGSLKGGIAYSSIPEVLFDVPTTAHILGGAAMGVANILCLSGDGVQAGDHPQAKPVFDLDCMSLLEIARNMRDNQSLPLYCWAYFGMTQEKELSSGYTWGLQEFGLSEMEIVLSKQSQPDVHAVLYDAASTVVVPVTASSRRRPATRRAGASTKA